MQLSSIEKANVTSSLCLSGWHYSIETPYCKRVCTQGIRGFGVVCPISGSALRQKTTLHCIIINLRFFFVRLKIFKMDSRLSKLSLQKSSIRNVWLIELLSVSFNRSMFLLILLEFFFSLYFWSNETRLLYLASKLHQTFQNEAFQRLIWNSRFSAFFFKVWRMQVFIRYRGKNFLKLSSYNIIWN